MEAAYSAGPRQCGESALRRNPQPCRGHHGHDAQPEPEEPVRLRSDTAAAISANSAAGGIPPDRTGLRCTGGRCQTLLLGKAPLIFRRPCTTDCVSAAGMLPHCIVDNWLKRVENTGCCPPFLFFFQQNSGIIGGEVDKAALFTRKIRFSKTTIYSYIQKYRVYMRYFCV